MAKFRHIMGKWNSPRKFADACAHLSETLMTKQLMLALCALALLAACSPPDPSSTAAPAPTQAAPSNDAAPSAQAPETTPPPQAQQAPINPDPSRARQPAVVVATAPTHTPAAETIAPTVPAPAPIAEAPPQTPAPEEDLAAAGSRAFAANCGACHTASENGAARVGPNLFGVAGRRAASLPGFNYSPALRNSGITWTPEQLRAFIQQPTRLVPGTRMSYAGVRNADQAAAIVAYLESLH